MSNVKHVSVRGDLPFCCNEDPSMRGFLADFNAPLVGIRIKWGDASRTEPNEHDGITAFVTFELSGYEAVATDYIRLFIQSVGRLGGKIFQAEVMDVECGVRVL